MSSCVSTTKVLLKAEFDQRKPLPGGPATEYNRGSRTHYRINDRPQSRWRKDDYCEALSYPKTPISPANTLARLRRLTSLRLRRENMGSPGDKRCNPKSVFLTVLGESLKNGSLASAPDAVELSRSALTYVQLCQQNGGGAELEGLREALTAIQRDAVLEIVGALNSLSEAGVAPVAAVDLPSPAVLDLADRINDIANVMSMVNVDGDVSHREVVESLRDTGASDSDTADDSEYDPEVGWDHRPADAAYDPGDGEYAEYDPDGDQRMIHPMTPTTATRKQQGTMPALPWPIWKNWLICKPPTVIWKRLCAIWRSWTISTTTFPLLMLRHYLHCCKHQLYWSYYLLPPRAVVTV